MARVYVTSVVPALMPENMPDVLPIAPTAVDDVPHTPPLVASVKVPDAPMHTTDGPLTGAGAAFTETGLVLKQPVGSI